MEQAFFLEFLVENFVVENFVVEDFVVEIVVENSVEIVVENSVEIVMNSIEIVVAMMIQFDFCFCLNLCLRSLHCSNATIDSIDLLVSTIRQCSTVD